MPDRTIRTATGQVYSRSMGHYFVELDGALYDCRIASKMRKHFVYKSAHTSSQRQRVAEVHKIGTVDPIAVGDIVDVEILGGDSGKVLAVHERRNKLSRRAPRRVEIEQIVVANVDQVMVVMAATFPEPNWNLLDRFLVSAEASGIPIRVCVTKIDLFEDRGLLDAELEVYRSIGYEIVLTSSETGEGIDAFKALLKDRLTVLVGMSGVGKSTIINTIQPDLELDTQEVSEATGKGRHTTTMLEMHKLDIGARIVDTPGMREFGLWDSNPRELERFFPDFRPYLGLCRHGNKCSHLTEPGCNVRNAVEDGDIDPRRYDSYRKLLQNSGY